MISLAKAFPQFLSSDAPLRIRDWKAFAAHPKWQDFLVAADQENAWPSLAAELRSIAAICSVVLAPLPAALASSAPLLKLNFSNFNGHRAEIESHLNRGGSLPLLCMEGAAPEKLLVFSLLLALALEYRGPVFLAVPQASNAGFPCVELGQISGQGSWLEWTRQKVLVQSPPRSFP
jgi:hypothetical protein